MQLDLIDKNFSKAASTYDYHAIFQYYMADVIIDKIHQAIINRKISSPQNILDIGCGTGILGTLLRNNFPNITLTSLDISQNMLKYAAHKLSKLPNAQKNLYICGSGSDVNLIENIVKNHHIDLIVSNLCFQWFKSPIKIYNQYRKYAPTIISTLGTHSFYQWYEIIQSIEPTFTPPITLTDIPDKKSYNYHIFYKTGHQFLRSQKQLGTLSKHTLHQKPLSVKQLKKACHIFENKHHAIISYFANICADFE